MSGECGVITAAVFCVNDQRNIKNLGFKFGIPAIRTEQAENILCCRKFRLRTADDKTLV